MKANKNQSVSNRICFWIIGISALIQILISFVKSDSLGIEKYYSKGFYPIFSCLNKFLFGWIPFSVGDLLYVALIVSIIVFVFNMLKFAFRRQWMRVGRLLVQLFTLLFALYSFFYINWGLNYFREPLAQSFHLEADSLTKEDYLAVLDKYIPIANELRAQIDYANYDKAEVKDDIEQLMQNDTIFASILSKTQIKIKQPISSSLITYFTVAGYFNPFTSEVQVNQEIPKSSYPFTNVHELAHQMGIGFEDDCNFIAFRVLVDQENIWYRYSAYYNAIESLLRPLYGDKVVLEKYKSMLSHKVKQDFEEEYIFWTSYKGWLDHISSIFYNEYLQHNNQPEGVERYGMMARLIVAWEKQQ